MAVITIPNHNFQSFDMRLTRKIATTTSPFTYQSQHYEHTGSRWEAEVKLPPLTHSQAREWQVFFMALKGTLNTFRMYNPANATPHGTLDDGIKIGTAGSAGDNSVVLQRYDGSSGTLKAGDFIALPNQSNITNQHLHMLTEDVTFFGTGTNYTVDIQPPLKHDAYQNTVVHYSPAYGIWRLATPDIGFSINQASLYGFSFACVEADL